MDETIDRYVGGIKHVAMNVDVQTDISAVTDISRHDFPAPITIATL